MRANENAALADGVQDRLRSAAIVGLLSIALIHLLDLPSKLPDTVPIALAYVVLIAACVIVAGGLLHAATRGWWLAAVGVAAATIAAYILSRTLGLPGSTDDIGNWDEPLGIASLFVEGIVVGVAGYGWHLASRSRHGDSPEESPAASLDLRDATPAVAPAASIRQAHRVVGRGFAPIAVVAIAALAAGVVGLGAAPALADGHRDRGDFNDPGNVLIADQFNNRVIEVDPRGEIVWQFGIGPQDLTASSIVGVNDAERVGDDTLMAGTGIPPNTVPSCSNPDGCPDNRVLLVDRDGRIDWQYGQFGVTGSGPNELNTPVQATFLPDRHVLITDQGNQRVIEVNPHGDIVWQYGMTSTAGAGPEQLDNPNSAELLPNGHILIADESNDRVIEVTRAGTIVATFTAGGTVSGAAFASRLPNGDTLITDSNNSRAVEVDRHDQVVWQYVTNTQPGSNPTPAPTRAIRLRDGDTVISDQFNDRVIIVTPSGQIRRQLGQLDQPGDQHGLLNGPYDAKVIGDYTGLTPPNPFRHRDG
jgi:hypothetical protein